jgi:uncharacterized protein (TIRG00374 family)
LIGWYSLSKIPFSEITPYIKSANYSWLLLGFFFGLLSHLSRAYRWKYMLEPLGFKPKIQNSIMAVFVAYLTNFGIPRSGEVMRAVVFSNYENVPFEKGFGTIVAERIADMLVMLLIILITLFLQYDFISSLLMKNFNPQTLIIGLIILIILGAIFFTLISNAKSGFAFKIKTLVLGMIEGATSIFKMRKKWPFIAHTLFIWFMYLLMFYVTIFAVPELKNVPMAAVLIGFIAGGFSIAASNGGLFVYPAAILAAFSLFGLEQNPSFAFGWIMWTAQSALILIFGVLSFIFLPVFNREK